MTLFRSTLASLQGLGALALDLDRHVSSDPAMREAARKVAETFDMPARPSEEQLMRALKVFSAWCDGGRAPTDDDWMLAPWVCLQGRPRLMALGKFVGELGRRAAAERQPRLLKAMLHSYLSDWADDEAVATVGSILAREVDRHRSAWATRWGERAARVDLFRASGLVSRLSAATFGVDGDVRTLLRELGFTTELVSQSGLHEPLAIELAVALAHRLGSQEPVGESMVSNVLGFLRTGRSLRFPAERVPLAEVLLAPFATKDLKNQEAKAALVVFFDEVYGDPRSHPKSWSGVSQDARRTITRWLARKALDLFFDILSETADPIWRWRKAFWLALERKGAIDEAWPIFGREAVDWLAQRPEQRRRVAAHAKLSGAERKQSVMLMMMGGYVVAEWSHAGSVRIWAGDDVRAPSLDDAFYYAEEVRADCLYDQRHDGSQRYAWQSDLADWFAKRIGVRVGISEIRPHG